MNLYLQMGSNSFNETRHNQSLVARPTFTFYVDPDVYERDITEVLNAVNEIPFRRDDDFVVPEAGVPVRNPQWQDSGQYLLGQKKIACPVRCMYLCLAQHKETFQYFTMKVLNLKHDDEQPLTQDDIQGLFLIHNEYMLLERLKEKNGVYRVHDYYKEFYAEQEMGANNALVYNGRARLRICLVLDYVAPNDAVPNAALENLQQYMLKKKVLTELEATKILYEILVVLKMLHSNNIVHRDIKLANVRFDKETLKVTLVNFGFGQYLPSEFTLTWDQRGSPAYMAPDVLSDDPYAPKPSDMWSLGICYYVMLMGAFPFYDTKTQILFKKILRGSYVIPLCGIERFETVVLLKSLLAYNPQVRLDVDGALELSSKIIRSLINVVEEPLQLVPDLETGDVVVKEPEPYRWKFAAMQRGNRFTLKQDPGCQIPILLLTADEQRVKAIEMRYIRNSIVRIPRDIKKLPFTSGTYTGNTYLTKKDLNKIDQVVPEIIQVEPIDYSFKRKPESQNVESNPTSQNNPLAENSQDNPAPEINPNLNRVDNNDSLVPVDYSFKRLITESQNNPAENTQNNPTPETKPNPINNNDSLVPIDYSFKRIVTDNVTSQPESQNVESSQNNAPAENIPDNPANETNPTNETNPNLDDNNDSSVPNKRRRV